MVIRTEQSYLEKYNKILEINNVDILKEKLKELNTNKLYFDFEDSKILESLILEMKVQWPMNLIFSNKSLIKYKIIFRQLLILKYQEKKLAETWVLQQNFKEFKFQNYLKPSYLLRDKMINFVKNLIYYFFNEVIEPNFILFINNLINSKSIEDIISYHDIFLNNCLKECLLDNSEILILINDIIQTCLVYSKIIIKYYNSAILDEKLLHQFDFNKIKSKVNYFERRRKKLEEQNKILEEIFIEQKFLSTVENFRNAFESRLELFLEKINKM
jgi:gamma-tubulin complex component 2